MRASSTLYSLREGPIAEDIRPYGPYYVTAYGSDDHWGYAPMVNMRLGLRRSWATATY